MCSAGRARRGGVELGHQPRLAASPSGGAPRPLLRKAAGLPMNMKISIDHRPVPNGLRPLRPGGCRSRHDRRMGIAIRGDARSWQPHLDTSFAERRSMVPPVSGKTAVPVGLRFPAARHHPPSASPTDAHGERTTEHHLQPHAGNRGSWKGGTPRGPPLRGQNRETSAAGSPALVVPSTSRSEGSARAMPTASSSDRRAPSEWSRR